MPDDFLDELFRAFDERKKSPPAYAVNNYEWFVYDDGEVCIETTPMQMEANGGRVYLTAAELRLMLDALERHAARAADEHAANMRDALGED